jgi:hypothetical protein
MIFNLNKIMKKPISIIILGLLGIMALATPALAATTISLSPSNIAVTQGKSFNFIVQVDPGSVKNYTVKMRLQYPAELLEVKSFTFGGGWMALSQAGYDLVDNAKGVLVKTAGFPGGFSSPVTFGTVSFLAKKSGDGIIEIGSDSVVLDGASQNVFKDTVVQSSITITASLPPAEQAIPPEEETPLIPEEETAPPALFDILTQPEVKQSQRKLLIPILVGVGIIMFVIVGYILYRRRRKKVV